MQSALKLVSNEVRCLCTADDKIYQCYLWSTGGCDETLKAHAENKLLPMINPSTHQFDYDLIVIGGGSGGLAASKVRQLL